MKKYHAITHICIDGKDYNCGDIVYSDYDLPGLERDNSAPEIPIRKQAPRNVLFGSQNPKISVIITFHNQEEFVRECVGSFERQTIKEPYEVVCVLDRTTDRTEAIIKAEFPNAKIISVDYGNAPQARNAGARQAKGELLCYFDGDDYAFPDYLEKLKAALDADPGAAFSYARCNHLTFGLDKGDLPRCNVFEWSRSWNRYSPIVNTPIMIRKEDNIEFDPDLAVFQDAARSLELARQGKRGVHIREELWHYRTHPKSIWNQPDLRERRREATRILAKKYGHKTEQAECTFVSLISRDEVLGDYFAQIPTLGIPKNSHWLIMADTNDPKLVERIRTLANTQVGNFSSVRMFVTGTQNETYSRDFEVRGLRIGNLIKIIINQAAARMGGTPYLFMVEDDTIAPPNAYKRLKKIIEGRPNMAYASGIECGRGFTKHTGVCRLTEDERGEVIARHIPKMKNHGVEPIQGGGWYCWIGRVPLLKRYADTQKMKAIDGKMLGPDVLMVYDLTKMGFEAVVDFSIQCLHRDSKRNEWLPATRGVGYEITYHQDKLNKWSMKLTEVA